MNVYTKWFAAIIFFLANSLFILVFLLISLPYIGKGYIAILIAMLCIALTIAMVSLANMRDRERKN